MCIYPYLNIYILQGMLKGKHKKFRTELQFWLGFEQQMWKGKESIYIILHFRKFRLREDGGKGHIHLQSEDGFTLGRKDMLTVLSLPIHGHKMSFHLFVSSFINVL